MKHFHKMNIIGTDYMHAERVCKDFEIKNLGEKHNLYVQNDTLLPADVFNNFRNMHLEIYGLDPAHFISASGLAREAALKRYKVKFHLLNDIDMLLILEKGIRDGICHAIHRHAKANNKNMKAMMNVSNLRTLTIGM